MDPGPSVTHDRLRKRTTARPSSMVDDDPPRRWSEDSADAVRDHLLGARSPPGAWSSITSTEPTWPDQSPSPSPKAENIPLPATPPPEPARAAPEPPRANDDDDDEPLCRICFLDASASIEEPSLGRLIQPCLCRGTQARVHVGCLQRWRRTSASRASFWKCDQCGFRYQLRRTKIAGLAENRWAKGGVTLVVFLLLVTIAGYIAGYLVEASVVRGDYEDTVSPQTFAGSSWTDLWGYSFGMGYGYYDTSGRLMGDALGEGPSDPLASAVAS